QGRPGDADLRADSGVVLPAARPVAGADPADLPDRLRGVPAHRSGIARPDPAALLRPQPGAAAAVASRGAGAGALPGLHGGDPGGARRQPAVRPLRIAAMLAASLTPVPGNLFGNGLAVAIVATLHVQIATFMTGGSTLAVISEG